jgi:hypothetical protein
MSEDIVRYRLGVPIDPTRILEIIDLPRNRWGPIEQAYAEVRNAGPQASFRGQHNTTIFPPELVSARTLRMLTGVGSPKHFVYPLYQGTHLVSVLVHVVGGYASVHIYRLKPGRRG